MAALLAAGSFPEPARARDFSGNAVGTAGADFLTLDVDPRGIGMGTAYTALTSDAFALYWNPAGLSQIPRASAAAMHTEYLAGIRFQYAAYAQRISDSSVVGGAVRYLDAGAIDNTDISGNRLGTFRPRSYVYEVGWAQNLADLADSERDVSLGVTGRFFQSDFIAKAHGFAGDIGMQLHYTEYYVPYEFGLVVQNLGKGQKFDLVRDALPTRVRLGAAIKPRPFLLALEGVVPVNGRIYGGLGGEMQLNAPGGAQLFLRGGYHTRAQFGGLEGLRGLSVGLGAKLGNLGFDYAFVPFGFLGDTHRFSVRWDLPPKRSRRYRRRF